MDHIVLAIKTTGNTPSKGHQISELLAIRINSSSKETSRLALQFTNNSTAEMTLSASYSTVRDFIADTPVVTHDGYNWKRFARAGFSSQPNDLMKKFLSNTIDVSEWSKRIYPNQRKDIDSLCKRLKIAVAPSHVGLDREVEAVTKILPLMDRLSAVSGKKKAHQLAPQPVAEQKRPETFFTRLLNAGKVLRGIQ